MLTAAPCTLSTCHYFTFRAGNALYTLPNLQLLGTLVHRKIYGVIQQRVYRSQLYNANKLNDFKHSQGSAATYLMCGGCVT